jgi:hypothetical protein
VSREVGAERELGVSEDAHSSSHSQALGQGSEDFPNAARRPFEVVQDRAIADTEFCLAGLALEIPDVFLAAMSTTAEEGVDLIIGDAVKRVIGIWARVPSRDDTLLAEWPMPNRVAGTLAVVVVDSDYAKFAYLRVLFNLAGHSGPGPQNMLDRLVTGA